jgi:hypothetical protein
MVTRARQSYTKIAKGEGVLDRILKSNGEQVMIHTRVCGLLRIDIPIIQAGMGVFTSAELAAAVKTQAA